jgi:hypothetical protein
MAIDSKAKKSKASYLKSSKAAAKEIRKRGGPRKLPVETRRTYQKGVRHGGRAKGTPNKFPGLLKEALIEAAEYAGRRLPPPKKRGEAVSDLVAYLSHQAIYSPNAFMALLGRVLPLQIEGDGKNLVMIDKIEMVVVTQDGRHSTVSTERGDEVLSSIEGTSEVLAVDGPSSEVPRGVGRER